jgi:hypothetical protein
MKTAKAAAYCTTGLVGVLVAIFAASVSARTVSLRTLEGRWTTNGDCSAGVSGRWSVAGDRIKFSWPGSTQSVERVTGRHDNVFDTETVSPPQEAGQRWSYEIQGDNVIIYDHQNNSQQVVSRCRMDRRTVGRGGTSSSRATFDGGRPTFNTESYGHAPCSIGDGYQTVHFSNGATYSGSFSSCKPLAGPAQYQQGLTSLSGYAEPIDDHTIKLRTDAAEVTITLQIQRVYR